MGPSLNTLISLPLNACKLHEHLLPQTPPLSPLSQSELTIEIECNPEHNIGEPSRPS